MSVKHYWPLKNIFHSPVIEDVVYCLQVKTLLHLWWSTKWDLRQVHANNSNITEQRSMLKLFGEEKQDIYFCVRAEKDVNKGSYVESPGQLWLHCSFPTSPSCRLFWWVFHSSETESVFFTTFITLQRQQCNNFSFKCMVNGHLRPVVGLTICATFSYFNYTVNLFNLL